MSEQQYIWDVVVWNGHYNIHDKIFRSRDDARSYCDHHQISYDKIRCFGRSEYWKEADEEERDGMSMADAWNWDEEEFPPTKTITIEDKIDILWDLIQRSQIPILGDDGIPITTKELCRKQVIRDINQQDNSTL